MIGKLVGLVAAGAAVYAAGKALAHRQRCWTVVHGRDGYKLELSTTPLWAVLADKAQEMLPCTCGLPEGAYDIGSRWFGVHDDGSGQPLHSLGSLGYGLCLLRNSIGWRFTKQVALIPIAQEGAWRYAPEWVCDDADGDGQAAAVGHQTYRPDDEEGEAPADAQSASGDSPSAA